MDVLDGSEFDFGDDEEEEVDILDEFEDEEEFEEDLFMDEDLED